MPHTVRKPRSSPCSIMTGAGESSPPMGECNAYDLRYSSDSNENDALEDSKPHVHQSQPIHSSSRSWRHCPSSRLSLLTRRQDTISSDTSTLSGDPSQASVSLPQDTPGPSLSHLKTLTNRVSSSSPVSASGLLILSSSPSPSSGGGRPSATGPANTRRLAPFVSRLIPISDATFFSTVQTPSAQKPSLLPNLSRSSILTTTSFTPLSTSEQVPERDLLNITSGSLTTSSPNPSTTVQAVSSALTGLSTGFSLTRTTTLPTTIQDSTSMSIPPFSTTIAGPPSNISMVSTPTTSGPSSSETLTTIEPTLNLTSDSRSTSVIASSTFVPITTFNISSSVTESSSEAMTSSFEDHLPTSSSTEFTKTSSMTRLPTEHPALVSIPPTSIRFVSTSTYTSYQTITDGPTITYTTLVESGVLISDKPRPDDNAFAHNTGAIIGVAVSAAFVVLVILIIVFLSCQRYKRNREREGGNISRESFLRRELELDPDILSRPRMTGRDNHVTIRQPGSISFNLSPNDGRGGVGGSDENVSTESAGMYPIQSHAFPPVGGMDTYALAPTSMPGSPGVHNFNAPCPHNVRSSDNITHRPLVGSPTIDTPMGSPTQTALPPTYAYPHENPQQTSGVGGDNAGCVIPSTSGHGYYSTDGHTTPACLGSSSHGHTVNNFGVLTSSSGHARSMSTGGMLASSSEHGTGAGKGIGSPWLGSKSDSSSVERWAHVQAPPSSYIPPRGTRESTESSGSNSSSARSLFRKFRSMRKLKKERREELNRRLSLQSGKIRASMAQNSRESMTMAMGHGSILGHAAIHRPPSSLLNPPNPPPVPPVPSLQYPAMMAEPAYTSQPLSYSYVPPLNPRYSIGVAISDSPYLDAWPPPISPSLPSLVPTGTDASSYIEGLLNPHMLPRPSGTRVPGGYGARDGGPDDKVVNGSKGGEGVGRYSLWMNEYDGRSTMSLRDHVDYSRPISGAVAAMGTMTIGSTPTFGTDRDIMEEAREGTYSVSSAQWAV